jgi:hypothetical protein
LATQPQDLDHERRIIRMEERSGLFAQELADIKATLRDLDRHLRRLPTRADLWRMIATVVGISVATIALFVGILAYLGALPRP